MKAVKFTLTGRHAFFKNPEVNAVYYPTYGHIHKVALLGLFGAILGYGGYGKEGAQTTEYPEFYERLKHLKIAIVPKKCKCAYFDKKIQCFNNSVGYASQEKGGNLIIKEQWLENPCWEIYLVIEDAESENIVKCLQEHRCTYIPYLGKNDHPADILNVEIVHVQKSNTSDNTIKGLIPGENTIVGVCEDEENIYKYSEYLPIGLSKEVNGYQLERFTCTSLPIENCSTSIYNVVATGENIVFF